MPDQLRYLPLAKISGHPLNSNEMVDEDFQKLRHNIATNGHYPALIVRPYGRGYQLIDGWHRYLVLQSLGYTRAKCEIWRVNDAQTHVLLASLNRLRGADDFHKRAQLIHQINQELDQEELLGSLPDSENTIRALLATLETTVPSPDLERAVMASQLTDRGIARDTAQRMANYYQPPSSLPVLRFVFADESAYNKAVKYFGEKPDVIKLMDLLKQHEK